MPDATDVENGDLETDEEVPDELVNDDGKQGLRTYRYDFTLGPYCMELT